MDKVFGHIVAVFGRAPAASVLSFVVATPWCQLVERFDPTLTVAGCHRWLRHRACIEFPADGQQDNPTTDENTCIFVLNFLQNDAGSVHFPTTEEKILAVQTGRC